MDTFSPLLDWLLEPSDPSVRYRTLTELLHLDEADPQVKQARSAIPQSAPVQQLLKKMHPDGYWLQRNSRTRAMIGDGVEYGAAGTTHFCLAYLSELGMDRSHPSVEKAAERYLDLQQPDGDWYLHLSCLLGYNLRTFVRLGYGDDPRLQRTIGLLLHTDRPDGGYLCDLHEKKHKRKPPKSCIRGAVKVLLAFAELPRCWDHPRCRQLVNYFLCRGGIFKSTHPGVPANQDMLRQSFPITWGTNAWEVLYGLAKMGYGADERLEAAWQFLEQRAGPDGRYPLDRTPAQAPWKVGPTGESNKWVTFYVLAAQQYRYSRP